VGIHHDAKLEPYYTIKLRDGKEKQTDGKHLTPLQEKENTEKSVVSEPKLGSDKTRSSSSGGGKKEQRGDDIEKERNEILVETVTEGESSSEDAEGEVTFIDYGDDDDDDVDNDKVAVLETDQQPQEKSSARRHQGAQDRHANEVETTSSTSSYTEEEQNKKTFTAGQDAYYRAPNGIHKVHILSHANDRYTISFPDGSQQENIRSSQLATLMDLTSKELSGLMKERNKRQHNSAASSKGGGSRGRSRHWQPKRKSSSNEDDATINNIVIDEGYEASVGEPTSPSASFGSSLEQSQSTTEPTVLAAAPAVAVASTALAINPRVQMVQAKTEDGTYKTVPKYASGMTLYYKNAMTGIQGCTILTAHLDDLLDPYYDVKLEDGREKQTDNAHLMLTLDDDEEEGKKDKGNEGGQDEGGSEHDHGEQEEDEEEEQEEEQHQHQEPSLVQLDNKPHADEAKIPRKDTFAIDASDRSGETTPASKKPQVDPAAATLIQPAKFATGDDVLYNSSQGEHLRAVVLKLHRDKKNRPYYVIRLSKGKEKQVYGHRLRPYVRQDHEGVAVAAPKRRSRSRGRSGKSREPSSSRGPTATSARLGQEHRGRSTSKMSKRESRDPPKGRESIDSMRDSRHKSVDSVMSNSSRRSRASRERHAAKEESLASTRYRGSREESLASARDGHRSTREESVTRDSSRHASGGEKRTPSRRSRSQSIRRAPERTTESSRRNHGRERSRIRAPSEDASRASSSAPHQFSMSHHHHAMASSTSRGTRQSRRPSVSTPSVSMSSKAPSRDDGGDDHYNMRSTTTTSSGRSISRLKSFRNSFSSKSRL